MLKIQRKPTTPGEILSKEFLKPLNITHSFLAKHIYCDIKVINRIVNGKSSVTAEMAIKLADIFNTSLDFWLIDQHAVDIFKAEKKITQHPASLVKAS